MAVIECVFNYDKKTGKVTRVTHVLEIDEHDEIRFVSPANGLTLECEDSFPPLNLKKGDMAKITYTTTVPGRRVPNFKVYYHGPVGHFHCRYKDGDGKVYQAKGQSAPGSGSP